MASDSGEEPGPSILTKKQRRRLSAESDDRPGQAKYQMHSRIRKRLRQAIYDFELIYDNWDELSIDKVFENENIDARMMDGTKGALSTLYRGLEDSQLSFESLLIDAIWRAEVEKNDRGVDVQFGVEAKIPGSVYVNDAAERINPEQVNGLRIPEMRAVLEGLAHSDADIPELVEEGRKKQNPHYDDQ